MRDVHWSVTVFYQQIENGDIANQIHEFTIDDGKFILMFHMLDTFEFYLSSFYFKYYFNKLCFQLPHNITWTDE